MRKVVYIAHPLGAGHDREQNRENAAKWVAWAATVRGVAPVADWIVLSGELTEEHRKLGLECDFALIARCDELWLVGGRISPGMQLEADFARRVQIPKQVRVYDMTHLGALPPREARSDTACQD
jgi:hypothetical protein